ncbi:MAG: TIGR01777 family protein [Streptosporangiales bacterium]|nr:TIGR01777 family protein [Streptosporangiales bacterium]
MRIAVTGSSGLVGTALGHVLEADGHEVVRLVRRPPHAVEEVRWDPAAGELDLRELGPVDAAVNLAGAGIGDHRWSAAYKRTLVESRTAATGTLATALAGFDPPPRVLLSASGVGAYGPTTRAVDEDEPRGTGFVPDMCRAWEAATEPARLAGVRVCHLRFGIVLSRRGGALAKLLPLFRLGLGGRLGSGEQYWSWVALADVVRAVRFLLDHELRGPVNVTSPYPVTNAEFTRALGATLRRPTPAVAPAFALRAALGEYAGEVLGSQQAVPRRLLDAGFRFRYPTVREALDAAVRGY